MPDEDFAVGQRVRVHSEGHDERCGVIVEDFSDAAGHAVEVGGMRIAEPARRWAVQLADGSLVFVDSNVLSAIAREERG